MHNLLEPLFPPTNTIHEADAPQPDHHAPHDFRKTINKTYKNYQILTLFFENARYSSPLPQN